MNNNYFSAEFPQYLYFIFFGYFWETVSGHDDMRYSIELHNNTMFDYFSTQFIFVCPQSNELTQTNKYLVLYFRTTSVQSICNLIFNTLYVVLATFIRGKICNDLHIKRNEKINKSINQQNVFCANHKLNFYSRHWFTF